MCCCCRRYSHCCFSVLFRRITTAVPTTAITAVNNTNATGPFRSYTNHTDSLLLLLLLCYYLLKIIVITVCISNASIATAVTAAIIVVITSNFVTTAVLCSVLSGTSHRTWNYYYSLLINLPAESKVTAYLLLTLPAFLLLTDFLCCPLSHRLHRYSSVQSVSYHLASRTNHSLWS